MNALVRICAGEARANSRDVAASFEKEHRHVLRSIDQLLEQAPEACAHFWAVAYQQGGNAASRRAFDMDRDGFALLAMGFTGPKALRWKLAYIDAFNRMEAELRESAAGDEPQLETSAAVLDLDDRIKAGLAMVREARMIGGRIAAKRAWELAGLPDIFAAENAPLLLACQPEDEHIGRWAAERCTMEERAREWAMDLFLDYQRWCHAEQREPVTMTAFGRALSRMGVAASKSTRVARCGLRLRPVS